MIGAAYSDANPPQGGMFALRDAPHSTETGVYGKYAGDFTSFAFLWTWKRR